MFINASDDADMSISTRTHVYINASNTANMFINASYDADMSITISTSTHVYMSM